MDDTNRKTNAGPPLTISAISALHRGNKIEAIKIVRQERNIGLKEAKDVVDDYVRSQPALQSVLTDAQTEAKRSALVWLVVLIAAFLGFYFLIKP